MLEQLILIIHMLAAIAVIGLILLQQGKGADMGASFGSGASQTVMGVQGSGNLLTRSTAILATAFFLTSLSLAYYAKQKSESVGVEDALPAIEETISEPVETSEIPAAESAAVEEVSEVPAAAGNSEVPAAAEEEVPAQ